MWPIKIILEAGVNHEGSLSNALQMVEAAAECDVYAIKFQTYKAATLAAKNSPRYWDATKEPTSSQIELFSKFDKLELEDYREISRHCIKHGILFATTFFDEILLNQMDNLVTFHKIASADITNFSLIRAIARKGKPILLSTGASTFEEVSQAVEQIFRIDSTIEITLLHCVLNYPTEFSNANLQRIQVLRKTFPTLNVGYSDHTLPEFSIDAIGSAFLMGATVIETHFTLNKALQGNDHYHALDPSDVHRLREKILILQALNAYDESKFIDSQHPARMYARRGIYARENIVKNEAIKETDLICLRPVPENGFAANAIDALVGKLARRDVKSGEPLSKGDIS